MKDSESIARSPRDSLITQNRVQVPFLFWCCLLATCVVLSGFGLLSLPTPLGIVAAKQTGFTEHDMQNINSQVEKRKVPVEVHIESKCPDARDCLQKLVVPAYWQVNKEADLKISYVGEVWEHPRKAVTCQHGWNECDGNKLLVCAERHASSISHTLGFTNCVLSDYERVDQLELIQECAHEHEIDYKKIKACADEQEGQDLLISSVQRSVAARANFSCTIRVNGETWCTRDDYKWGCEQHHYTVRNLVEEIQKLYGETADMHSTEL